jgi:hypothetical protein
MVSLVAGRWSLVVSGCVVAGLLGYWLLGCYYDRPGCFAAYANQPPLNGQRRKLILTPMKRVSAAFSLLLLACGPSQPGGPVVSKEPISVRGWVTDVDGGGNGTYRTVETEAARKAQLYQSINVWVEGAPYVSGGLQENGSFLLLDVPPGNVTISFAAPGAPVAKLVLQNVPGNADVYVPALVLAKNSVKFGDPAAVQVRMAAQIDKPHPTGRYAVVAGQKIAIVEAPLGQLTARHEFPTPPGGAQAPLATVK